MTCPSCGSHNIRTYNDDHWRCKDCEWIFKSLNGEFKSESGHVKINGTHFTKLHFGANRDMEEMVNNNIVYKYTTKIATSKKIGRMIAYNAGAWIWDVKDLIFVDSKGNDLNDIEIAYPEPQQFDSKFLDI